MIAFDASEAHRFLDEQYRGLEGVLWIGKFEPAKGGFFDCTRKGIGDAVKYAAWLDHALRPTGIYFRVTTVREPLDNGRRGGAADSRIVPMYWADLDFGAEGHKPSRGGRPNPPTFTDAVSLVTAAGLPEPTVLIHSGGGAYPLWRINRWPELSAASETSERIQAWLHHAAAERGWSYGTGVGDLARVLRLPGSLNRKNPANPRPCRIVGGTGELVTVSQLPQELPPGVELPAPRRESGDHDPNRPQGPADVIAELCGWEDILGPAGWTRVGTDSRGELWLRPGGADSKYSARAFEHNLVCHSEAAGLPSGAGQRLTKARVYAELWHGGDLSEAVTALLRGENYGDLPEAVLEAVRKLQPSPAVLSGSWRAPTLLEFMQGENGVAVEDPLGPFLATYTRYLDPWRLGRRVTWMKADGRPRLPRHASQMVQEVLEGRYPADRALDAVRRVCLALGVTDPTAPRALLSEALEAAAR